MLKIMINDGDLGTTISVDFGNDFVVPTDKEMLDLANLILKSDAIQHIKWRGTPELAFVTNETTSIDSLFP